MADTAAAKKDLSGRAPMTITGDAIHAETIRKELRNFRLNENFILSPTAIKNLVLTSKPNNIANIHNAAGQPGKKLIYDTRNNAHKVHIEQVVVKHGPMEIPRTTSSVYGWDTEPLMKITDRRFYHPKQVTEITKMYGTTINKEKKREDSRK